MTRRFLAEIVQGLLRSKSLRRAKARGRFVRLVADASYLSYAAYQRRVTKTLAMVFPSLDRVAVGRLTRTAWRSRVQSAIDQRELESLPPDERVAYCASRVTIEGGDEFDRVCDAPEPVVVFSPHYGNFALGSLCLILRASSRKKVHLFYNPSSVNTWAPTMARLVDELKCNAGSIVNDGKGPLRALRALRGGDLIGIMPDVHDFRNGTLYVPFFGKLVLAMGGTAFLALRSRARVVPMYCYRDAESRVILRFDPPLELPSIGRFEDRVYEATCRVFANMEAQLRSLPEHWWFWDELISRMAPGIEVAGGLASGRAQLAGLARNGEFQESRLTQLLVELRKRLDAAPLSRIEDQRVRDSAASAGRLSSSSTR